MKLIKGYTDIRMRSAQLPEWLDSFIYCSLGGRFSKSCDDMTVIDWDRDRVLDYLGTYFPRSYTESYCIFKQFFSDSNLFADRKMVSVLDFGCGTGGEVFGFAEALSECRPGVESIMVKAIDGNQFALNCFGDICDEFNKQHSLRILSCPSPVRIDDFYDLRILDMILDSKYDVVLSFKAVCEFVTNQQFEEKNAYEHLSGFMLPRVSKQGVMLLADVTSKNRISKEWLTRMMDQGLAAAGVSVCARNRGYNEEFFVSHSKQFCDSSRIAWRLIVPSATEDS